MGHIGIDGPSSILFGLYEMVFLLMFYLDKLWGNIWYFVRGVVTAARGDHSSWPETIRKLSEEPLRRTGGSGSTDGAETGEARINFVVSVGGLARPSATTELLERVSRVRRALPDDVGVVAVDGVLLEASTVRQLAQSEKIDEYVVIVGPCCVSTAYQVGLVTIDAFSVVEDLKPASAVVHPLVPRNYKVAWSFPQVLLRFVLSILTLVAVAIYGAGSDVAVNGFPITSIVSFALNIAVRVTLRPSVAQALRRGESNVKGAAVAPEAIEEKGESKAKEEAGDSRQGVSVVRTRPKMSLPEFLCLAFPGTLYGLSALTQLPHWMRWALLAIGGFSSILFTTSGSLQTRLTGPLSALLYPAFVVVWVLYLVVAVALNPVGCLIIVCFLSFSGTCKKRCLGFIFIAWLVMGATFGISALAGHHLVPAWVLYTACVGFVPGTLFCIAVELFMAGSVDAFTVQDEVKKKYFSRYRESFQNVDRYPYGEGYKHVQDTGLNVRYVPVYVEGADHGVSVINRPGDAAGTCWRWVGGISHTSVEGEADNKPTLFQVLRSLTSGSVLDNPGSEAESDSLGLEPVSDTPELEPALDAPESKPVLDASDDEKCPC